MAKPKKALAQLDKKLVKITSPTFRISYPCLHEARGFQGDTEKTFYSLDAIFDKKTDLKPIRQLVHRVAVKAWGEAGYKAMVAKHDFNHPIKDASQPDDKKNGLEGYDGNYYAHFKNSRRPGCFDSQVEMVPSDEVKTTFYAGSYCQAVLRAYPYDTAGNKGVNLSLEAVKFVKDGERLDGGMSLSEAQSSFEAEEDGSDDESSYSDDSEENEQSLGF